MTQQHASSILAGQERRKRKGDAGFTLIELILVTVIIAILAGMVTLTFRGSATDAKIKAARGDIKSYESAIELYALKNNDKYPDSLKQLVEAGHIRELNTDPWGKAYIYLKPGKKHKESYDIFSSGPDGEQGTEDDVAPWLDNPEDEAK